MSAETLTLPVVGAHFRPPAKAILSILRSGAPLRLRLEPENPHDPNAIAVEVNAAEILPPGGSSNETLSAMLEEAAQGYGFSAAEILSANYADSKWWHLGYIPRSEAEHIAPRLVELQALAAQDETSSLLALEAKEGLFEASLAYAADGKPQVRFTLGGG